MEPMVWVHSHQNTGYRNTETLIPAMQAGTRFTCMELSTRYNNNNNNNNDNDSDDGNNDTSKKTNNGAALKPCSMGNPTSLFMDASRDRIH